MHHAIAFAPRSASEDRAAVFMRGDTLVIAVADGAGGVRGGGLASQRFVDAVANANVRDPFDLRAWTRFFEATDAALASVGETTAIVIAVSLHALFGMSVGDSQACVVRANDVDQLTNGQVRIRLGSGRARPFAFHRKALDGVLIVATDGLFTYAKSRSIVAACALENASSIAAALVEQVKLPTGDFHDDVAVVVVR